MTASKQAFIKAYRDLYKTSLQVIQYARPERYTLRNHLRNAFRAKDRVFDPARIANTLEFLDHAAKVNGLEHKIVKNLLHVWWTRSPDGDSRPLPPDDEVFRKEAYADFDETVEKLNESMGLCLT